PNALYVYNTRKKCGDWQFVLRIRLYLSSRSMGDYDRRRLGDHTLPLVLTLAIFLLSLVLIRFLKAIIDRDDGMLIQIAQRKRLLLLLSILLSNSDLACQSSTKGA
ncbi:hypothetical protein PMAYCL1PPCAC_00290, partial [Pristionchus mayeri]